MISPKKHVHAPRADRHLVRCKSGAPEGGDRPVRLDLHNAARAGAFLSVRHSTKFADPDSVIGHEAFAFSRRRLRLPFGALGPRRPRAAVNQSVTHSYDGARAFARPRRAVTTCPARTQRRTRQTLSISIASGSDSRGLGAGDVPIIERRMDSRSSRLRRAALSDRIFFVDSEPHATLRAAHYAFPVYRSRPTRRSPLSALLLSVIIFFLLFLFLYMQEMDK